MSKKRKTEQPAIDTSLLDPMAACKLCRDKLVAAITEIPSHPMRDKCFSAMAEVRTLLQAAIDNVDAGRVEP